MKTKLLPYLSPSRLERVICLEETESTNTCLKSLADSADDGTAVIARRQSGGRGRVGRSFSSPEGGVYLSLLRRISAAPGVVTAGAAVAVRRAIKRVCGLEVGIKWVNDLLADGKKLCGILTELEKGAFIIGVGVNVSCAPADVPNAGCLADFGCVCSAEELAAAIIEELDALVFDGNDFRAEYTAACLNLGRELLVVRGDSKSIVYAEGMDEDFGLVVRYPDGKRESVFYGEVSLRASNGE